ncbi:hypothetical protein ACTFIZ_001735 [Dictyostelium cf. discoideum]
MKLSLLILSIILLLSPSNASINVKTTWCGRTKITDPCRCNDRDGLTNIFDPLTIPNYPLEVSYPGGNFNLTYHPAEGVISFIETGWIVPYFKGENLTMPIDKGDWLAVGDDCVRVYYKDCYYQYLCNSSTNITFSIGLVILSLISSLFFLL